MGPFPSLRIKTRRKATCNGPVLHEGGGREQSGEARGWAGRETPSPRALGDRTAHVWHRETLCRPPGSTQLQVGPGGCIHHGRLPEGSCCLGERPP